eukprot:4195990-Pleurochrysis_carterae.AAC.3
MTQAHARTRLRRRCSVLHMALSTRHAPPSATAGSAGVITFEALYSYARCSLARSGSPTPTAIDLKAKGNLVSALAELVRIDARTEELKQRVQTSVDVLFAHFAGAYAHENAAAQPCPSHHLHVHQ